MYTGGYQPAYSLSLDGAPPPPAPPRNLLLWGWVLWEKPITCWSRSWRRRAGGGQRMALGVLLPKLGACALAEGVREWVRVVRVWGQC